MFRATLAVLLVVALLAPLASAKDGFTVRRLETRLPMPVDAAVDRDPGDVCTVGVTETYWALSDWIAPPEEYANYCDPASCTDCPGGWMPIHVNFALQFAVADTFYVSAGIRAADLTDPMCPVPDAALCWSSTYEVDIPGAGAYLISLPLNMGCTIVTEPFFGCVAFESAFASGEAPDVVTADGQVECFSYNDWGLGWKDLYDYGFPGPTTISVDIECQAVEPDLDIKPGSCPNPLNVKSKGVLPVAILGTSEFDVSNINPESLMLAGAVPPLRWNYEDVGTPMPFGSGLCDCNDYGPDGYMDMTLKFENQAVVAAIAPYDDGDEISITITGELMDGTPFTFDDCVWIIDKTKDQMLMVGEMGAAGGDPSLREKSDESTWGSIKALYR